jgi:hypothetical protein
MHRSSTVLALTIPMVGCTRQHDEANPRIDQVFKGLRPPVAIEGRAPVQWSLAERMAALHVPGISIAIIDSGREQITRSVVALDTAQLAGLVGTYAAPGPGDKPVIIAVTREGDRLFFEVRPFIPPTELYPASADSFFTISNDDVAFRRDRAGVAHTISLGG